MLGRWIKSWKGKKRELSLDEWEALCLKLQKELKLNFDLCNRAYFELEVNGESVDVWIKREGNKVIIRTF